VLRKFIRQIGALSDHFEENEKLSYMLSAIEQYLKETMEEWKSAHKELASQTRQKRVAQYSGDIQSRDDGFYDACKEHYELLDTMAFAYDHPTPLLLATRYREYTCGYALPSNGDGPFQIVSKDYGTGEISKGEFIRTVEDYLQFSQNKYDRFEKANSGSWLTVDVAYASWTKTGLVRHAALYNGLSGATVFGDIQPAAPWYAYDRFNEAFSGSFRDGVLTTFTKAAAREESLYDTESSEPNSSLNPVLN